MCYTCLPDADSVAPWGAGSLAEPARLFVALRSCVLTHSGLVETLLACLLLFDQRG